MIQNLTKLYEGANLSGAIPNVIYIPILFDCDLKGVDVLTDAAVSGANAVFSLSKNGVIVPAAAAQINVGSKIDSVTGLDLVLFKGDEIVLNLASGAISSPVTLNLRVDDLITFENGEDGADGSVIRHGAGVPADALGLNNDYYINTTNYDLYHKASGAYSVIGNIKGADGDGGGSGLPSGDLNASTNKIEKIQNYPISLPVGTQPPVDDEFINLTKPDLHSGVAIDNSSGASTLFGGEVGTVLPTDTSAGHFIRYPVSGDVYLELKGFINGSNEPGVRLEKSTNGGSVWTDITPTRTDVTAIEGSWSYYKLIVPVVSGATHVRIYFAGMAGWYMAYVGRFQIMPVTMTDKSVMLYDLGTNTIKAFSLVQLKAALNALP